MDKDIDAFRTISEVADDLALPQHVLRFWELRFPQIKPMKRSGGRRYYRPDDLALLRAIKHLLYDEGYTIKGVQRILKEQGARAIASGSRPDAMSARAAGPAPIEDESGPPVSLDRFDAPRMDPPISEPRGALEREDARRLRGVLLELEECERILAAARED